MEKLSKTVFILGAGFTRAFAKNAPLLKVKSIDLKFPGLELKYKDFPKVLKIIKSFKDSQGNVNVEELLTRLSIGMPFDLVTLSEGERKVLLEDIRKNFFDLILQIQIDNDKVQVLRDFSQYVIDNSMSCITFNYDTFLDRYLWETKRIMSTSSAYQYFHPDGGYGFFCRPAVSLISDGRPTWMDHCSSVVYKLHGSLNWRIKIGSKLPYTVDSLVHDEEWLSSGDEDPQLTDRDRDVHLEQNPFIINPILDKSEINSQSILKTIWSAAYEKILESDRIIFIGYSLPKTDIAAKFLFKESLSCKNSRDIIVINLASDGKVKDFIMESYREVFPDLLDKQFIFSGAEQWIQENCVPIRTNSILSEIKTLPGKK